MATAHGPKCVPSSRSTVSRRWVSVPRSVSSFRLAANISAISLLTDSRVCRSIDALDSTGKTGHKTRNVTPPQRQARAVKGGPTLTCCHLFLRGLQLRQQRCTFLLHTQWGHTRRVRGHGNGTPPLISGTGHAQPVRHTRACASASALRCATAADCCSARSNSLCKNRICCCD